MLAQHGDVGDVANEVERGMSADGLKSSTFPCCWQLRSFESLTKNFNST